MTDQDSRTLDGAELWFLANGHADWVSGLADGQRVAATVSDLSDSTFVSVIGEGRRIMGEQGDVAP